MVLQYLLATGLESDTDMSMADDVQGKITVVAVAIVAVAIVAVTVAAAFHRCLPSG